MCQASAYFICLECKIIFVIMLLQCGFGQLLHRANKSKAAMQLTRAPQPDRWLNTRPYTFSYKEVMLSFRAA